MPKISKVKVEESVGTQLIHDITIIEPKKTKAVLFKRGHVIRQEDIPLLKKVGSRYIYVIKDISKFKNYVHEDDFSKSLANVVVDNNFYLSGPSEGKITIFARKSGILKVNVKALNKINMLTGVKFSTKLNNSPAFENDQVAIVGLGPLFVKKRILEKALKIAKDNYPILTIKEFQKIKVGLIVTGNEIYEGLVKDAFTNVLREKLKTYNLDIYLRAVLPDDRKAICEKILEFISKGCDLVIISGGMGVDPDDVTPLAIKDTGAKVVFHYVPVFPGSSIMLAYYNNSIPIYGTTASPIFYKRTTLDIFLPRFIAKDKITKKEVAEMGHGGLMINDNKI